MSADNKEIPGRILLEGVRLSFQSVFAPRALPPGSNGAVDDEGNPVKKYSASFLIPKDGDLTAVVNKQRMPIMEALKASKLAAIAKKVDNPEKIKIKPENYAVKDGNHETYEGYENCWYVSAKNKNKPAVVGRDKRPLAPADDLIYSGCYVNALLTLWYLPAGKIDGSPVSHGVHCALEAVQFVSHGERFGAQPIDVDEAFEDLTDGDDDALGEDDVPGDDDGPL